MRNAGFIRENANKDYVCSEFTEVVRDLIRAISAEDDYSGGLGRAARQMAYVSELISKCEEDISWYHLFAVAIENLRPEVDWDSRGRDTIDAAQAGMSMLMEVTCTDNAARGRTSKKEDKFLRYIRMMEDAKEERLKQFAEKRKKRSSEPNWSAISE